MFKNAVIDVNTPVIEHRGGQVRLGIVIEIDRSAYRPRGHPDADEIREIVDKTERYLHIELAKSESLTVSDTKRMMYKPGADNLKYRHISEFVTSYIHDHYAEDITLGHLSNEIQISKNYLGYIFKNVLGETFKQYLTRVRMEKAKLMIMEGRFYIYEVAAKVGYSNIPYFTSQFKKYVGSNPTDFLKQ